MSLSKPASTDLPLHPLLAERWSPRAFDASVIDASEIATLFEAARWAPSCFNAQPWRFLVAARQDAPAFERLLACLVPANQSWAKEASVLAVGLVELAFAHNGKPNAWAQHDLGLALSQLVTQATSQGLSAHMMAGFDAAQLRESYGVPEGFEPLTAIALGRATEPSRLPEALAARETAPRERRPLRELCFGTRFGEAWTALP